MTHLEPGGHDPRRPLPATGPGGHGDHDLRRLLRAADPAAGRPGPLLGVTGEQLRARAARRRRRRRTAALTAAAAVLAALTVHFGQPAPSPDPPVAPAPDPVPLAVAYPDGDTPARAELQSLTGRAAAAPDTTTRTGPVTHTTVRAWTRDGTDQEIQAWWKPDGSARETREPAAPGRQPVRLFAPGQYPVAVAQPAALPEALSGQLNHYLEQNLARNLAHAVADMNRFHCLTPAQRAAALRVLADAEGLVQRGGVTDRHGRTGLAVSMDDPTDGVRHLLVFDPGTGALLSYEQIIQVSSPTSPVRAPALLSYVVYLACEQIPDGP